MTEILQQMFDDGIKRYEAGEPARDLVPLFRQIVDQQPKNGSALTCLAWLYLLSDDAPRALKAAKQAIKLNPADAQSYVNLALAMLDTDQKGVREPVERAQQIFTVDTQQAEEVHKNLTEALERKPGWKAVLKVQQWLYPPSK